MDYLSQGPFATVFAVFDFEKCGLPRPASENCLFRLSEYVGRLVIAREEEGESKGEGEGKGSWPALVQTLTSTRLGLPGCTAAQPCLSEQWYTTKVPIPGFIMCRTCFVDHVLDSKFQAEIIVLPTEPGEMRTCSMLNSASCAPLVLAMDAASEFSNWSIFWDVAARVAQLPPCGSEKSEYLTLAPPPTNMERPATASTRFVVCALHAYAYLAPYNILPHLIPVQPQIPPEQTTATQMSCALNPRAQHTLSYLSAAQTSLDTSLLAPFQSAAARLSVLPPCPFNNPVSGRAWYGWPAEGGGICPSCYEAVVLGTSLAGIGMLDLPATITAEIRQQPTSCVLYSKRMRGVFAACARNGSDIEGFRNEVSRRARIWAEICQVRAGNTEEAVRNNIAGGSGGSCVGGMKLEGMMGKLDLSGVGGPGTSGVRSAVDAGLGGGGLRSLPSQVLRRGGGGGGERGKFGGEGVVKAMDNIKAVSGGVDGGIDVERLRELEQMWKEAE